MGVRLRRKEKYEFYPVYLFEKSETYSQIKYIIESIYNNTYGFRSMTLHHDVTHPRCTYVFSNDIDNVTIECELHESYLVAHGELDRLDVSQNTNLYLKAIKGGQGARFLKLLFSTCDTFTSNEG